MLYSIIFFANIVKFMRYVEKYGKARRSTDDRMIQRRKEAICIPGN
jgi:hypothetical protein